MLELTTPSLLFSAISLILLAYTNRFLSYASVVRDLKSEHDKEHDPRHIAQIRNLYKRLHLIQAMQIFGIGSLLFCVVAMFMMYISHPILAEWLFGIALLLLVTSLAISIWEINISVEALKINLSKGQPASKPKNSKRFRGRRSLSK